MNENFDVLIVDGRGALTIPEHVAKLGKSINVTYDYHPPIEKPCVGGIKGCKAKRKAQRTARRLNRRT